MRRSLLAVPGNALRALELSASGDRLATLSIGPTSSGPAFFVRVWNLGRAGTLYSFDGRSPRKHPQLALSADGARLAFYAGDEARVFEVASGQELANFELPQNPGILALDPRGSLLAVTDLGARNTPATWQTGIFLVERQKLVARLPNVRVKAWSQEGKWLLTQGNPGAGTGPELLEAQTYTSRGSFTLGELTPVKLSATPTYDSDREYTVTGTVQLGPNEPQDFRGRVFGAGAQRYENRQAGRGASFRLKTVSGWEVDGFQAKNGVWKGYTAGLTRSGSQAEGALELKRE